MKKYFCLSLFIILVGSLALTSCKKESEENPPPPADTLNVNLGHDKVITEGDSAILDAGHPGSTYLWSTGAVTQTVTADTTGIYWVKVTNGSKSGNDTIKVELSYKLPKIETDFGSMIIWLYFQTPLHRNNYLNLVSQKFYDSLIFHRVIKNFVNQGGDPLGTGYGGPGYTIPAEIRSSIKHVYGAVGAARKSDNVNPEKESNGSQFYIVNNKNGTPNLDGNYTVFGIVVDGSNTIDAIAQVPTNPANDRPLENVYMTRVSIVYYTAEQLVHDFGFIIPK